MKVAIVGAGQFAQCFIPLYQAHPLVTEVSLCDIVQARLIEEAGRFGVSRLFNSFEEVISSNVDAVVIFTQRWMHAPMAIAAMKAGKHVYSAVPAAVTLEELQQLIDTVKHTGLTYMMGETSVYYGSRLYCLERFTRGDMGRFVYGEGEYYHDMSHGFYESYRYSGGADWKRTAGFPPMLYPTHSISMILSITGARMTSVSCLGTRDEHEDGIFRRGANLWDNIFSNQTALFRTSDGGMARINEFRRVGVSGGRSVRLSLYGTEAAFEEQVNGASWTDRRGTQENVEGEIVCGGVHSHEQWEKIKVDVALKGDFASGFARVHQKYRSRLPESYRTQPNGHEGSHQFLTDDFVTAVQAGKHPTVSVWDAARFNAPGIVAHESAKRDGEVMSIPDFGSPASVPASQTVS